MTISSNHYTWWCASEKAPAPTFNLSTGNGTWSAAAHARSCGSHNGRGASDDSYTYTDGIINLVLPVALAATNHGVSVGWDLDLRGSTNTSYGAPVGGCPWFDSNSTSANASTMFYYSFQYQWCDVEAVISIVGSASLEDLSTGQVTSPANHWGGFSLASGRQIIDYRWIGGYSNRSYWSKNFSYSSSDNWSFGNTSSFSGTISPKWYINGTFRSADRYEVVLTLNDSMATESFLFFGGKAQARLSAGAGAHHEDLAPIRVY